MVCAASSAFLLFIIPLQHLHLNFAQNRRAGVPGEAGFIRVLIEIVVVKAHHRPAFPALEKIQPTKAQVLSSEEMEKIYGKENS